jgi:molybdopterin-guanine dinucleotide biosynthesis protein A
VADAFSFLVSLSSYIMETFESRSKLEMTMTVETTPGGNEGFSGVVLCGGHSTRMGTDKAFLRVGSELLIERQLRCLREAGAAELMISASRKGGYSRFGARLVHDEPPGTGPLAGLTSALRAASFPRLLVLAVDLPAMTAAMLGKIISLCHKDVACVPVDDDGRFQPLAAAYPKAILPLAERQLYAGKCSMREFVTAAVTEGLIRYLEVLPEEQIHFTNWNRPDDWTDLSLGTRSAG